MPQRYRLTRVPFDQTFRGTTSPRSRSIICGGIVNANMGFAVSKVYIQQYFDGNARNEVFQSLLFCFCSSIMMLLLVIGNDP